MFLCTEKTELRKSIYPLPLSILKYINVFMSGFLLVIISALFHAGWNVLLKRARSKLRFNLHMHLASVVLFTVVVAVLYPQVIEFDLKVMLTGLYAAVFFALYHLFVAKAYELADVSQVYPVTTSSPLFVTVWAAVFLHEQITLLGVTGIVITIAGCMVMNGASLGRAKLQSGVLFALLAAFAYSFGALFDKLGVNTGSSVMYTYWMNLFMTVFFVVHFYLRHRHEPVHKEDSRWWIWLAGITIVASSLTYRFGIEDMPISYGVAIRQVSGLFGVIMGVVFFKEGYGKMRFVGTIIIIGGIMLLRLGI